MSATPHMDAAAWHRIKNTLADALERPPGERRTFLDGLRLAAEDRHRVERFLKAYEMEPDFLETDMAARGLGLQGALEVNDRLSPGQRVDDYRIVRQIGQGGMGEVYEAEQLDPIQRRVALKLLRWGPRDLLARFAAERQLMASLHHRHVARVYGAGSFDGRPYLTMELLDGVPITEHCQRHRLSVVQRLRLFIDVCQGVQHAHQRGIIHRDLKPSNILVHEEDGQPVPKVIDFGISKTTDGDNGPVTQDGSWLGTPNYMSPEQARDMGALDTRSDVYSLGVVLYELLTGSLPFDVDSLRRQGFDVLLGVLTRQPPLRPSQRCLEPSGDARAYNDAWPEGWNRRRLSKSLRGDLDNIVLKALEKDPNRRYATPQELAQDIQRHLQHRPVTAQRSTLIYQLRKLYRRRRLVFLSSIFLTLSLGLGILGLSLGLVKARAAQRETLLQTSKTFESARRARLEIATNQRIVNFMWRLLRAADPGAIDGGPGITLEDILQQATQRIHTELADEPLVQARLMNAVGQTQASIGSTPEGLALLEEAGQLLEDHAPLSEDLAYNLNVRGEVLHDMGQTDRSLELLHRSLDLYGQLFGEQHRLIGHVEHDIGRVLQKKGKLSEALERFQVALEIKQRVYGPDHRSTLASRSSIGWVLLELDRLDDGLDTLRTVAEHQERTQGADHPDLAITLHNMADGLRRQGKLEHAETLQRRALAIDTEAYGVDHPYVGLSWFNLSEIALAASDCSTARQHLAEARRIFEARHQSPHPNLEDLARITASLEEICGDDSGR